MPARHLALFFSATHVVVCLVGLVRPRVYGATLGPRADPGRLRVLAALDAPFALAVTHGVLAGRPLRTRLRVGAVSDFSRAVAIATLFPATPKLGRGVLVAASLSGAATATALSARVD